MPISDAAVQAMVDQVRLLANDPVPTGEGETPLFSDDDMGSFLALEANVVKRAAAQAIDTIADNEVLIAKVIKDHDLSTNGAAVADSLRKRAATLREQADDDEDRDGFAFDVVDIVGC